MKSDFWELAKGSLEEMDAEAHGRQAMHFACWSDFMWFLFAKTAIWGLFALVEAVRGDNK